MNSFTVDILTPSKVVAQSLPAESLLVPTAAGEVNILKGHTHVISQLATGVISVFGGADDPDRFYAVSSGACKILNDKVTILAGTAEEKHEIDLERAQLALKNAEEKLKQTDQMDDEELLKYERKAERARLRIQMAHFKG